MAVPGKSRPRSGLHWPQIRVVALGPLRLDQVEQHEAGARPARGSGRRGCGAARRRSAPPSASCSTYGRRSKYECTATSPSSPGSSRKIQRIGWVTENTHAPAGPQHPDHLAHHRGRVGDERHRAERGAGDVERPRRRTAGPARRPAPAARVRRCGRPPAAACRSMPADRSRATTSAPWCASQRAPAAAPQPTSSTRRPAHVAEQPGVGLAQALGAPDEVDVAEERRRARPGSRRRRGPTSAGWRSALRRRSPSPRSRPVAVGRLASPAARTGPARHAGPRSARRSHGRIGTPAL